MITVAALYVEVPGVYCGLEGVDPWGTERDARTYAGPHPVVAHPPCERWGRYWSGGPNVRVQPRKLLGDDGGCFAAALASVRTWGGVLEHPEASHAWRHHGLLAPPKKGGWIPAGDWKGWTCCVEQGHYGHPARKATWLYYVGDAPPPELIWGPAQGLRLDDGYHTAEERRAKVAARTAPTIRIPRSQRARTPLPFRDLLIEMARGARRVPCE